MNFDKEPKSKTKKKKKEKKNNWIGEGSLGSSNQLKNKNNMYSIRLIFCAHSCST